MLLVDGEAQVEQLELTVVSIEEVPASSAVLACTPHILPEAVQGGTLLGVPLRVIAIGVLYVLFQRVYPVDFVGGLERHRNHGNLGHGDTALFSQRLGIGACRRGVLRL